MESSVRPFRDGAVVVSPIRVVGTTYTLPTDRTPTTDLDLDILPFVVLPDDDHRPRMDAAALLALVSLLQMDTTKRQYLMRNRTLFGVLLIFRHDFPLLKKKAGMGGMVPPLSQRLPPTD